MPILSMTGFARAQGQHDGRSWTWEVKSVNGRGLEVRCRLPFGLEGIEPAVRQRAQRRFQRGNIQVALNVVRERGAGAWRINREMLDQVLTLLPEIEGRYPGLRPPSADGLLALKGVIETVEDEDTPAAREAVEAALLSSLDETLDALAAMRANEGTRLAEVLAAQLEAIARLCDAAASLAALKPATIRERLRIQVATLLEAAPGLPEERLAQEAALLMAKADVKEELDRLTAHVAAARELIDHAGPVGRKLDFLCQEFNREANTLCSKSADVELTRVGLDLKAAIEQMREQVQNIE